MSNDISMIDLSKLLRVKSLDMALSTGSIGAHLGGGLSAIEIMAVLFGKVLNVSNLTPKSINRDRLIVSKGHCVLAYYSVLNHFGFLTDHDIKFFETNGSFLHGHATRNLDVGIEFSGGSLSMGAPFAVGSALSAKLKKQSYKVYCLVGDGECDEGLIWESCMAAANFKLDNYTVIVDCNKLQYDGPTDSIMNKGSLASKFASFGFHVVEVDGHNVDELERSFQSFHNDMPTAIIAHTIKGKGVSFMENVPEWHHSTLSQEQYNQAISEVV